MHTLFRRVSLAAAVITLLLIAAACGGDASTTTTTMSDDDMSSEFAFGEPTDAADADRTIEIVSSDDLTFTPSDFTVTQGEVITFRVSNEGAIPHDFTLGDQATQDEHEQEMAEMGGMTMPDEPNAIQVAAGETREITWRFTEAGVVLIGCHQAGHYDAGMRGEVTVEP
jgi:uncharacterized cupredoxin-like copper-binding protein